MKQNRKIFIKYGTKSMISIYYGGKKFPCFRFLAVIFWNFKLTCHTTSLCWMVWLWPALSNSSLGLPTHSHYMRCSVCLLPNAESEKRKADMCEQSRFIPKFGPKSSLLAKGFKLDSSARADNYPYNIPNNGTPTSIHIPTNSLFTSHPFIWSYTLWAT